MMLIKDPTSSNPYLRQGFKTRKDYLVDLAEAYGVPYKTIVLPLADLLGPEEDFDGLLSMLEDYSENY